MRFCMDLIIQLAYSVQQSKIDMNMPLERWNVQCTFVDKNNAYLQLSILIWKNEQKKTRVANPIFRKSDKIVNKVGHYKKI